MLLLLQFPLLGRNRKLEALALIFQQLTLGAEHRLARLEARIKRVQLVDQ